MKKYLLGAFAITLAICFSAFTGKKNVDIYYFPVDEDGIVFTETTILTSEALTRDCFGEEIEFCEAGLLFEQVDISGSNVSPKEDITPANAVIKTKRSE